MERGRRDMEGLRIEKLPTPPHKESQIIVPIIPAVV